MRTLDDISVNKLYYVKSKTTNKPQIWFLYVVKNTSDDGNPAYIFSVQCSSFPSNYKQVAVFTLHRIKLVNTLNLAVTQHIQQNRQTFSRR